MPKRLLRKEWPSGLLPATSCQPALRGGKRKDERASHTRTHAHDPFSQPYAHARRFSHTSNTLQQMCTFLQAGHTKRVITFLNTASTMHALRGTNHTPVAQATPFSAAVRVWMSVGRQSVCLVRATVPDPL